MWSKQCCQTVSAIDKACGAYLIFGLATETETDRKGRRDIETERENERKTEREREQQMRAGAI